MNGLKTAVVVGAVAACVFFGADATGTAPGSERPADAVDFLRQTPLMSLLLLLTLGLRLGKQQVQGLSLGTSAVLFVGLLFGHFGLPVPEGLGSFGLVLFVYSVGLNAGPGFFRAFASQGRALAQLAVWIVGIGASIAAAASWLLDLPAALAAGMLAGALTSTPGLAAAIEAVASAGGDPNPAAVGYGLAYPIGVVGVVLGVQLLPRVLKVDLAQLAREQGVPSDARRIERTPVVVENPAVVGHSISELKSLAQLPCQVTRIWEDERLVPIRHDRRLQAGDVVLLVADAQSLELAVPLLGRVSERAMVIDSDQERAQVVITNPDLFGRTLEDLRLPVRHGVILSRILRHDVTFVPSGQNRLRPGDQVQAVGSPEGIQSFMQEAGHRARALHETDLVSLAAALAVGVLLGVTPILPPGTEPFQLGLAGGPLLVGLVLGHFGRVGGIQGYVPRAARLFMGELGLALFLAEAGVTAGEHFVQTVQEQGVVLFAVAAAVTFGALFGGLAVALRFMKLDLLRALGGLCGGMTSTPGIGALTARTDSDAAVTSYATAYPVALILMSVSAQAVVSLLG